MKIEVLKPFYDEETQTNLTTGDIVDWKKAKYDKAIKYFKENYNEVYITKVDQGK